MTYMVIFLLFLTLYNIGYKAHKTADYRRELEMVLICAPLLFCLAWETRNMEHAQEWVSIVVSGIFFLQMFVGVIYATFLAYRIWNPKIHLSPQKNLQQT